MRVSAMAGLEEYAYVGFCLNHPRHNKVSYVLSLALDRRKHCDVRSREPTAVDVLDQHGARTLPRPRDH